MVQTSSASNYDAAVRYGRANGLTLALVHLGALLVFVPGTFSWSAVAIGIGLFYVTGAFGIALSFHRVLTHRSVRLWKPLEYATALLGTLALQGGPIEWVATHRKHHAHTDAEGDPHSVRRGLGWAHIAWIYRRNDARLTIEEQARFAPDLTADRVYVFLERYNRHLQIALYVALFALGGLPWLVWGGFVRVVATYHVTWIVNSAGHRVGTRPYRTGDMSTNNPWIALLAWGEGWHNNHHAFPFSARHGLRRNEFDVTWLTILLLAKLRVAHEIKLPTEAMLRRLRVET